MLLQYIHVSGNPGLSFENPMAVDSETQEQLAEGDEEGRGEATRNRISSSSFTTLRPKKRSKSKPYVEWAVIGTVIVVIWGLLTLPSIYFHMPQVK